MDSFVAFFTPLESEFESVLGEERITALFWVDISVITGEDSQVQITLINILLS